MNIPRTEIIDLGEYKVTLNYDGDGGLEIMVYDELGDEIEGLDISNYGDDDDDTNNQIEINPN